MLYTYSQSLTSWHPTDYSLRLPQGWRQTISPGDMEWIGRCLFVAKGKMTSHLKLWWYPPGYEAPTGKPLPEAYHQRRLFLSMPRKMWKKEGRRIPKEEWLAARRAEKKARNC